MPKEPLQASPTQPPLKKLSHEESPAPVTVTHLHRMNRDSDVDEESTLNEKQLLKHLPPDLH